MKISIDVPDLDRRNAREMQKLLGELWLMFKTDFVESLKLNRGRFTYDVDVEVR